MKLKVIEGHRPLGSRVVLKLPQVCKNPVNRNFSWITFSHNNHDLLVHLKTKNYKGTDKFREKRLMHCPLIDKYEDDEKEDKRCEYIDLRVKSRQWSGTTILW